MQQQNQFPCPNPEEKKTLYMTTPELLAIRWMGVSESLKMAQELHLLARAQQPPFQLVQ